MPTEVVIAVVLLLACAALLLGWLRRRATTARENAAARSDRIDTLTGWPPTATRVLTLAERQAYSTLLRALPDRIVLAQVPLFRFLSVPKRHSYADWLRRLGNQCADFLICDADAQVIAVIELQPPAVGPNAERTRRRLERMARTLKAARVPMHVWPEGVLPSAEAARESILSRPAAQPVGSLPKAGAVTAATATPTTAPLSSGVAPPGVARPPAANPFDDSGRDSELDERIEAQEPPPSTWYDDFDSGPAPLRKR